MRAIKGEAEKAAFPLTVLPDVNFDPDMKLIVAQLSVSERIAYKNDRSIVGAIKNDIVFVNIGGDDSTNPPTFRLARVHCVFLTKLESGGYGVTYRVRFLTKQGNWSRLWRDIFPRDIQRAHYEFPFRDGAFPRNLPTTIPNLEWYTAQW